MFLIKGIKERPLASYAVPGNCTICERHGTTLLVITQRYVHLFWVPVFPLPKSCRTHSEECTFEVRKKSLAPALVNLFS